MVLGRKTNFFLGQTKKTKKKKKHLLRHYAARHQKDGFLVFPREKDGFGQENQLFPRKKDGFGQKNQLFPRKKMVLGRKTNFFLGKRWFWQKNQLFPSENQKNHLFWSLAA